MLGKPLRKYPLIQFLKRYLDFFWTITIGSETHGGKEASPDCRLAVQTLRELLESPYNHCITKLLTFPPMQIFTYRSKDTSLPYGEHQLTIMVQRQTSQTTANNGAGFLASQWLQLDGMNKTQMYTGQPKITTLRDAYPGSLVCNTIALWAQFACGQKPGRGDCVNDRTLKDRRMEEITIGDMCSWDKLAWLYWLQKSDIHLHQLSSTAVRLFFSSLVMYLKYLLGINVLW